MSNENLAELIAFRVTPEMGYGIEKWAQHEELNPSAFIRTAIAHYIGHIQDRVENEAMPLWDFTEQDKEIQDACAT